MIIKNVFGVETEELVAPAFTVMVEFKDGNIVDKKLLSAEEMSSAGMTFSEDVIEKDDSYVSEYGFDSMKEAIDFKESLVA